MLSLLLLQICSSYPELHNQHLWSGSGACNSQPANPQTAELHGIYLDVDLSV